ncbi:VP3 [Gokushovirus WZ-2015a]|nr:VP3 [Gokushovirus WZ-2015a]
MRSQMVGDCDQSSFYVAHEPVDLDCSDLPSQTRQEFAEECDINTIMAGYERTGVISHMNRREPMYVDLSEMPDNLADTLSMLESATAAFMSLPAKARAEFDNDAVKWVDFASDPRNNAKMVEWGLTKPADPIPEPVKVEVVSTAPPAGGDAAK